MGSPEDPGYERVTDATRQFELEDEQVFPGAGRGPTPSEADVADHLGPVSDTTRSAYHEMLDRGAHQKGEGRITL